MLFLLVMCLVCRTHGKKTHAQVYQYSGADHKAFKHKMGAEVAFMKFWQIDGGNVQQGSSSNTYSTHSSSSSNTPSTEESSYCTGDVKHNLLKYQLNIAIEQRNHAIKTVKLNARMLNAVASQVLPMMRSIKWHI